VEAQPGKNQTYVVTNYGKEIAGTLTRRAHSSPHMMGGQNVVCMASAHANAEICRDMSPTVLSHAAKTSPIVCMTDGSASEDERPIVIDRAAYNQGENAKFQPRIEESDVMSAMVAKGPHAVAYKDQTEG
jgi:hypothetical protein